MNQPQPESVTTSWSTKTHWIIAITALCLLGAAFAGYFYHRYQMNRLSSQYLRLIVSGPSAIHLDSENRFEIRTLTIEGKPIAAEIQFIVRKSSADSVLEYHENVPKEGLLDIIVDGKTLSRAKLGSKPNDWVEIAIQAVCQSQMETYTAKIPIAPEYWLSQLQTSKIGYSDDEPMVVFGQVRQRDTLRSWQKRVVANSPQPEFDVFQQSVDSLSQGRVSYLPSGKPVFSRVLDGNNTFRYQLERPVKSAPTAIGSGDSPFNLYELTFQRRNEAGRSAAGRKGNDKVETNVLKSRQYAFWYSNTNGAKAGIPDTDEPTNAIKASDSSQVEFFPTEVAGEQLKESPLNVFFVPEGGRIIADLDNRVFFMASQNGRPRTIQGKILDADGKTVALTESNSLGIGAFEFFPRFNTQYWFVSTEPADRTTETESGNQSPSLNSGAGFQAPRSDDSESESDSDSESESVDAASVDGDEFRIPLPSVLRTSRFTIKGKRCVLQPDETEVTFTVQTNQKHLPLVAELEQRGAALVRVPFFTQDVTTQVSVPLPESFSGFGKVTVYDYSNSRPIASVERVVFRHRRPQFFLQTEKTTDSLVVSLVPTSKSFSDSSIVSVGTPRLASDAAVRSKMGNASPEIDRDYFLTLTEPSTAVDFDFANLPSELFFNGMATLSSTISLDKIAQILYSPELISELKNAEVGEQPDQKRKSADEKSDRSKQVLALQESAIGLCRMAVPRTHSARIQSRTYPLVYDNFPILQTRLKTILREYFSSTHQALVCATSIVLFLGLGLEFFVLLCWVMGLKIGSKVHLLAFVVCVSSVAIALFLSYSPREPIQDQNRFINYTPPLITDGASSSKSSFAQSETDSRWLTAAEIQYLQNVEKYYRAGWEQNPTTGKSRDLTADGKLPNDGLVFPKVYYSRFGKARLETINSETGNAQDSSGVKPVYRWLIPLKEINTDNCWIRLDLYGADEIQSFYQPVEIPNEREKE